MKHLTLYLALFAAFAFQATFSSAQDLIASYSLFETAADATGNYADMTLINTPYEEGGVYVNGNYIGGDPDSSNVQTPFLTGLTFASFTISADFKIAEAYTIVRPIIIGGAIGWRWLGAQIFPDGRLSLYYNSTESPFSSSAVTPGVWYRLTLTYDGAVGRLYLNETLEISQTFALVDGNDRIISTSNGATGRLFKGHLRNFKVYNGVVTPTSIDATPDTGRFALHQNTPNPFNPITNILYDVARGGKVTLSVYDAKGVLVNTLVDKEETPGRKSVIWDGKNHSGRQVATGVYFYRLNAPGFEQTRKMVLIQ